MDLSFLNFSLHYSEAFCHFCVQKKKNSLKIQTSLFSTSTVLDYKTRNDERGALKETDR